MFDGVFCEPCSLLLCSSERRDKGILVNKAFNNWSKLSTTLMNHLTLKYHHRCIQDAEILTSIIETPQSHIDVSISTTLSQRIQDNKLIIHEIVRAILFLAKQGLPFRGYHEDLSLDKNPGNFLAILKVFAENDEVLRQHLSNPRAKNATYISPPSQNEILNVIGYDIKLAGIVAKIKHAKFFSMLADEVSSHNTEHLPICIQYVDDDNNIM